MQLHSSAGSDGGAGSDDGAGLDGGADDGFDGGGVGGGSDDGGEGGGGGEAARLRSKDFSLVSPSVPRKTSGAALSSSAVVAGMSAAAAAALLLEIRAARWLALDATRAALARFLGAAGAFRPF